MAYYLTAAKIDSGIRCGIELNVERAERYLNEQGFLIDIRYMRCGPDLKIYRDEEGKIVGLTKSQITIQSSGNGDISRDFIKQMAECSEALYYTDDYIYSEQKKGFLPISEL